MSKPCPAKESMVSGASEFELCEERGGSISSGLILTADKQATEQLTHQMAECGLQSVCLGSLLELQVSTLNCNSALLLCEESLPDGTFRDALRVIQSIGRRIPVIVFSRIADWESYLEAVRFGAYDCLRYPFRKGELRWIVARMLRTSP